MPSTSVTLFILAAAAATAAAAGATADQYGEGHRQHRFTLLPSSSSLPQRRQLKQLELEQPISVPELQVGCADGSIRNGFKERRQKRDTIGQEERAQRERRNYVVWYGSHNEAISAAIPPAAPPQLPPSSQQFREAYQLTPSVPYWIPIWGNPRGVPVFFPSKPILYNPGYPARNKPTPTKQEPSTSVPTIGNRINAGEDDRPIWGVVESNEGAPQQAIFQQQTRIPQSAPRRQSSPPLIHKPSLTENTVNSAEEISEELLKEVFHTPPQAAVQASTPTTTRRPPVQNAKQNTKGGGGGATDASSGPNRCVWAIISCCSPLTQQVRYNCFEQLGCPGAFWDMNPCSREVTGAAINAAQKFYNQS